jgi:tetratricopeptide (TPR) repeat protein
LIARHYLAAGDFDQALQYAESVDGYGNAEAQLVVAECREFQHRWLAAEQAYRAVAEDDPYGPSVLLWHRYCAQTGYGSITTARNAVLGYVKTIDEDTDSMTMEPDALAGLGTYYLLENEPASALTWFTRSVDAGRKQNADNAADPRHGLHAAIAAHLLGNHKQRDVALDRVIRSGEKFVADGRPRRELIAFAGLLQKAFTAQSDAAASVVFDRAAVDELLAAAPVEDQALMAYLVGRMLDDAGRRADAQEFLRRAVAIPARDASRSLAAVLLRRHGVEPNEIAVGPKRRDSRTTGG